MGTRRLCFVMTFRHPESLFDIHPSRMQKVEDIRDEIDGKGHIIFIHPRLLAVVANRS